MVGPKVGAALVEDEMLEDGLNCLFELLFIDVCNRFRMRLET